MTITMKTRSLLWLPLSLALSLLLGCSSQKSAPSEVTGKVTYNGAPVTGGNMVFYSSNGIYAVAIKPDGTYTAVDLPEGEMVVTVDTEGLNPDKKIPEYNAKTAASGAKAMYGGKAATPTGGPGTKMKQESSPVPEGSPQGTAGTYVKIPKDYADKTKTPLKVTLKAGSQTQDFELKD